jgi:hypothetical protein
MAGRGELLYRLDKAIVHRLEQRRRRDGVPEIVAEEVAEAPRSLELRHVGVQIQSIETADLQRDVMADNVGDVGRHRDLLGRKSDDGTPQGPHTPVSPVPTSSVRLPNGCAAAKREAYPGRAGARLPHGYHRGYE